MIQQKYNWSVQSGVDSKLSFFLSKKFRLPNHYSGLKFLI